MAPSDDIGGFLPPPTRPHAVSGGIRLQSRRGGSEWWSRRWLAAFEANAVGERLAQGLEDARRGQVIDLQLDLGSVHARVQGTRREPHVARVELPMLEQDAWLRIALAVAARGRSRAALLSRQMPEDVEAVFRREGLPLFPVLEHDTAVGCSCDDWSLPCRHVLATCLLVSELLDAEPMQAFRLRGIEPAVLQALVTGVGAAPGSSAAAIATSEREPAIDPDTFWAPGSPPAPDTSPPAIDAPLVRILGAPALWRGADSFEATMRRLHAHTASDQRTIDLALGRGS